MEVTREEKEQERTAAMEVVMVELAVLMEAMVASQVEPEEKEETVMGPQEMAKAKPESMAMEELEKTAGRREPAKVSSFLLTEA